MFEVLFFVIMLFVNIVIKGKHLSANQALQSYAKSKSEKFYHYFSEIVKVEIELRTEVAHRGKESDFIADILVKIPGNTFKVTDSERDMYKAIDRAVKRMDEVLRREKERKKERFRRNLRKLINKEEIAEAFHSLKKKLFRRS